MSKLSSSAGPAIVEKREFTLFVALWPPVDQQKIIFPFNFRKSTLFTPFIEEVHICKLEPITY